MISAKVSIEKNSQYLVGVGMLSMIFLLVSACAAQQSVTTYSEDLSANRPKFDLVVDSVHKQNVVEPVTKEPMHATKNVNGKVDDVLDSIDRFNLTRRFIDGYTAQIYAGVKKDDAMNAKVRIAQDAPDLVATLQYNQPKFQVTVGRYLSKLEAQKDFVRLKRMFPNAILIPEKIQIR